MNTTFALLRATATAGFLAAALCRPASASTDQAHSAAKASPHHARHHSRHAQRTAMVAPTLTPGVMPHPAALPAEGPAPTPNDGVTAPIEQQKQEVDVHPSVFQLHYPPVGDGYVTGSSPQAMDDRNAAKATGMQMQVPLNQ